MGLTYITETAERALDEDWHKSVADKNPLYDPRLSQFVCRRCGANFAERADLESHQEMQHNLAPPSLLLNGRHQPFLISLRRVDQVKQFEFKNVSKVFVNCHGAAETVQPDILTTEGFWSGKSRAELRLQGADNEMAKHIIKIEVIDECEVERIAVKFKQLFARDSQVSWDQILDFEDMTASSGSRLFAKALADYLRGLCFRDGHFHAANATQANYHEAYNSAYSELVYHNNALAKVIVALINLTKSDFSIRRPTGVQVLDYLILKFFELKTYGVSEAKLVPAGGTSTPVAPTDSSLGTLLSFADIRSSAEYESQLKETQKTNTMLQNEVLLAKILYLSRFYDSESDYCSNMLADLTHTPMFREFLSVRDRHDR